VTCVVRLSPEKSPRNFVALLGRLGGAGFLRAHGLVPLMCGARSAEGYAGEIVEELHRLMVTDTHRRSSSSEGGDEEVGEDVVGDVDDDDTWPCVVLDRHMGPAELAAIFSRTAINVHVSVAISYLGFFFHSFATGIIARFFERFSVSEKNDSGADDSLILTFRFDSQLRIVRRPPGRNNVSHACTMRTA